MHLFDDQFDQLVGLGILGAGVWLLVTRLTSWPRATLLILAGAFWVLPTRALGGLSTQFVHRPVLAAAAMSPAVVRHGYRRAAITLVAFAAVSGAPTWADRPWITLVAWASVVVTSMVPGRRTLWPALCAELMMLLTASVGHQLVWLTDDDRRWIYFGSAFAFAWLVARDAHARAPMDDVLEASSGRSRLAVGFRDHDGDVYRAAVGDVVEVGPTGSAIYFDLGHRASAILVHDDPAFDDPAVRRQLDAVMSLLFENFTLLRKVDQQRRAVEASRQRLLEADQQAAQLMLQDVEFGVQPHLARIDATLTRCAVGGDSKAAVLLGQIREELRLLSSGLGVRALGDSMERALSGLVDDCAIPAHFQSDPIELSASHQLAVFMIASEAVANAVKHSGASHLMVSLHPLADSVQLTVTDDGCGGAVLRPGGGLTGIGERISALGGTLTVDAREGGGTVVTARLPSRECDVDSLRCVPDPDPRDAEV